MKKPKKHRISTLDQLLNVVTPENSERLAIDFAKWLIWYGDFLRYYRKAYPENAKGRTNVSLVKGTFVWTDDGKHEITGIELENSDTGEVTHIPIKKKPNEP